MASDWEPDNYYLRWAFHAFRGPWGMASLVGSILALLVPALVRYVPALRTRTATANNLLWQIPLGMLILLVAVRLLTTPKALHAKEVEHVVEAERKLREITNDRRPSIVVSRITVTVDDDPESPDPYTNEYLHFSNVGPETALNVRIEPIVIGGREIILWDPIDLIRPGDHADRMPRGGLSAAFQDWRKTRELDFKREIFIPLLARYSDRNGSDWCTAHAVRFQAFDVRISPVASMSDVCWTNAAAL